MKNKFFAILAAITLSIFFADLSAAEKKPAPDTPSVAVKTFFAAMVKGDFAKAKSLIEIKELAQMLTGIEQMIKEEPEIKNDILKDTAKLFDPMSKAKIVSEKITGDTAEVVISYIENEKTEQDTIKLKKVSGKWKLVEYQ